LPEGVFNTDLLFIPLGHDAKVKAMVFAHELRSQGITTEVAFGDRTLKNAMKSADKSGSRFVVVLGDAELDNGQVELKEMSSGTARSVTLSTLADVLAKALLSS